MTEIESSEVWWGLPSQPPSDAGVDGRERRRAAEDREVVVAGPRRAREAALDDARRAAADRRGDGARARGAQPHAAEAELEERPPVAVREPRGREPRGGQPADGVARRVQTPEAAQKEVRAAAAPLERVREREPPGRREAAVPQAQAREGPERALEQREERPAVAERGAVERQRRDVRRPAARGQRVPQHVELAGALDAERRRPHVAVHGRLAVDGRVASGKIQTPRRVRRREESDAPRDDGRVQRVDARRVAAERGLDGPEQVRVRRAQMPQMVRLRADDRRRRRVAPERGDGQPAAGDRRPVRRRGPAREDRRRGPPAFRKKRPVRVQTWAAQE